MFLGSRRGGHAQTYPRENSHPNVQPLRLKDLRLMATIVCSSYRSVWDYQSDNSGISNLRWGLVTVLEKHESGWWRGEFNGQLGVFPGNYVRLLDARDLSGTQRQLNGGCAGGGGPHG